MKKAVILVIIIVMVLVVSFIAYQKFFISKKLSKDEDKIAEGNMKVKSVFANNEKIPAKYTCDGNDTSPPLESSEIPTGTKTLAIIADDPDAPMGTWVHWLVWNIPVSGTTVKINEGEKIGTEGKNDFGKKEYGGPCPPSGTHRYFFKIYALDTELTLEEGSTKAQLEKAMKGHILAKAELIGLYSRK